MKIGFYDVFSDNGNGSYTPKQRVKIGGATFGPGGIAFRAGVAFSGVDIAKFAGHDLEVVKHENGIVEVTGVY